MRLIHRPSDHPVVPLLELFTRKLDNVVKQDIYTTRIVARGDLQRNTTSLYSQLRSQLLLQSFCYFDWTSIVVLDNLMPLQHFYACLFFWKSLPVNQKLEWSKNNRHSNDGPFVWRKFTALHEPRQFVKILLMTFIGKHVSITFLWTVNLFQGSLFSSMLTMSYIVDTKI